MKLSSRAYELYQVFGQSGCPVCRLVEQSVHAFIEGLMYEYVNEPATHFAVRDARGFCTTHAWHALEQINASALGIALLYEGVVRHLLEDMGKVEPDGGRRQIAQAAQALASRGPCPICTHRDSTETHLLRNLLEHLAQDDFAAAFGASEGLCLPHLRQALQVNVPIRAKTHLLALQQTIWRRLQRDLAEFVRKSDYQFADEALGEEADSPRRAIQSLAGAKGLR